VRRAALAHIVYSVSVGILGMLLLGPMAIAADWVGTRLDDPDGVLALAAFSSIFKFIGVAIFFPWLDGFSRFIIKISGKGAESAVTRLEPTLAEAGGPIALEAAWRALLEIARGSVEALRRRLAGEVFHYDPPLEAVRQTEHFLESLSLDTLDLRTIEPRLVRLCHAVDHLTGLQDHLQQPLPVNDSRQFSGGGFTTAARALAGWLDATRDPEAASNPTISVDLEEAARQISAERKAGRDRILEDVAVQRVPAATARGLIETLAWADGALHRAWRLAESLRIASGNEQAAISTREER
jgi:phosphate:Na+ symporter